MSSQLNPYLNFDGECEQAFEFYKLVFGGEFSYFSRFKEMPPSEDMPEMSESMQERVLHVSLPIFDQVILMGSDTLDGGECGDNSDFLKGNNISLSINIDDKAQADKLFHDLSKEGKVMMPMADSFWNAYFGMLVDKFGIQWMINVDAASQ